MTGRKHGELIAPVEKERIGRNHERTCSEFQRNNSENGIERVWWSHSGHGAANRCDGAAITKSLDMVSALGLVGFASKAMTVAVGVSSRSNSNCFASMTEATRLMPVILPPGRFS